MAKTKRKIAGLTKCTVSALHIDNEVLFPPNLSECGSTVAMRTSAAEVNQSQSSGGSSGQCFSNPSYHTVAQCNVVSTISSNLDGTLTHKVRPPCTAITFASNLISPCHRIITSTPNCALPPAVRHPEKQEQLRMESLLQPQ